MAKKYRFRYTAYALFFLAGAVVARFQWHVAAVDLDSTASIQYYVETMILVPLFWIPACVLALISRDPLLKLLAVGTALLFGFMILLNAEALNLYAMLFAACCLLAPLRLLVGLVFSNRNSRRSF